MQQRYQCLECKAVFMSNLPKLKRSFSRVVFHNVDECGGRAVPVFDVTPVGQRPKSPGPDPAHLVAIGHLHDGQEREANYRSISPAGGRAAMETIVYPEDPSPAGVFRGQNRNRFTLLDVLDAPPPTGGKQGWILCRGRYPTFGQSVRTTTDIVEAINYVTPKMPRRSR